MADEYDVDAEVSLDIAKAIKAAGDLARQLAVLGDKVGDADKRFDKMEKGAAQIGSSLAGIAKASGTASGAFADQSTAIGRLVKDYRELNAAQRAMREAGKNAQGNLLADGSSLKETTARIAKERAAQKAADDAMAKRSAETATAVAKERESIAEASRKRELAALKASIQQRVSEEVKAAAQIEAVWKRAHEQNAVRNATMSANSATRTSGGADPFAGLRETAAYTEMLDRSVQGLANQRYALYDVATTFGLISVATLGAAAAVVKLGGEYEKAFQQVARTTGLTGPALEEMRHQLIDISTTIPVAFGDIAEIATLGAQLNIANDNLDTFTTTVAQFAATTDVTVNAAAMGFGRLAQLTQTPQENIDRLGSAIYEVGVNSVATESEILAVSQQIATAGNLAGFTNTEVVALASTLASLGVAPEQSRGAIMRVFGDITAAVGEGGDKLRQFAQTSNMTSEAFAAQWRDSPQDAFNAYIAGLERVIKTNGDLDTSLKNQGFKNIRDRNVLTRLANNTEVYAAALDDTSRAYQENTALSEGAAVANDNLIDKLTVLTNTVKAVMAEVGQSDELKTLVDLLTNATKAALDFVETPLGKGIAVLVLGAAAFAGAVAALAAGAAMGKAALLAIVTALYNSRTATSGATLGLRALTVELLRSTTAGNAAAGAMARFRASTAAAGGGLGGMTTAARSTASGMTAAGTATKFFGNALKGIGQMAAPLIILAGVVKTIDLVQQAMKDSTTVAEEYFEAMDGADAGLSDAFAKDTKVFEETGDALRTVNSEVETSKTELSGWATQLGVAAGAQVEVNDATSTTTTAVSQQTTAIGENVRAWAAQTLANDESFQALYKNQQALKAIGFDLNEFLDATLKGPSGGTDYIQGLVADLVGTTSGYADAAERAGLTTKEMADAVSGLYEVADLYGTQIDAQAVKQQIMSQVMGDAGLAAQGLGEDLTEASEGSATLADGLDKMVTSLFSTVNAAAASQQALNDLGASIGENGNSFSEFSQAGRDNLAALNDTISAMAAEAGDDTNAFITNVGGLLEHLRGMGVDVQGELGFVGEMLGDLTNQQYGINLDTSAARGSIQAFISDAIKAMQAVAALEKRQAASLKTAGASVPGMGALGAAGALLDAKNKAGGSAIDEQIKGLQQLQGGLAGAGRQGNLAGKQIADGFTKGAEAAKKAGGAGKKAGKDAADGAKEIRTLLDYASDIESVFNRSFQIRFGVDQAADAAAEAVDKMRSILENADKAILDANEGLANTVKNLRDARLAVQEFNAELQSLQADRDVLEFQLRVAIEYGDDLRAGAIRAQLAENTNDVAKAENGRADAAANVAKEQSNLTAAEKAVAAAQEAAIRSLDGGTASSREQRAAVLALVQSYQGQIQAMAASGASTADLQRKTDQLEAEFRLQLQTMGYSRAETDRYAQSFRDLSIVLANVPRNVTVTANTNPAYQALNEFIAKTNASTANVNVGANVLGGGTGGFSAAGDQAGKAWGKAFLNATAYSYELAAQGMVYPGNLPMLVAAAALRTRAQYLSTGGSVGMGFTPKGTDTQPAMLTPGEYVVQKSTVDRLGLPFMNALNTMQNPIYRASGGPAGVAASSGSGGIQLVELMPHQISQIVQGLQVTFTVDGKEIAGTVNSYNTTGAVRGNR